MRDGVIDESRNTPAAGSSGFSFGCPGTCQRRMELSRQHKSGLQKAMQLHAGFHTGLNWPIYNGPDSTAAGRISRKMPGFHLRMEVVGSQQKLYVKDMDKPALVMTD